MQVCSRAVTYIVMGMWVVCFCGLAKPANKPVTCTLGEEVYNVNNTWHPEMNTLSDRTCVNCTCMPSGEVSCQTMSCPNPDCEEPRYVQGQCCATCDDIPNIPPTVKDDSGWPRRADDGADPQDCEYEGRSYRHLDMFPSNSTRLQPKNDSQCVMCNCYDGEVICLLQLCVPNPRCKKLVSVKDDCCKRCQEETNESLSDLDFFEGPITKRNRPRKLPNGACWWHKSRKDDGSMWNPVVAGKVSCVECTCTNGNVACDRKNCTKEVTPSCVEEDPNAVCDCKSCPQNPNTNIGKGKRKRKTRKDRKKKQNKEKKKKNKKNKKRCKRGKKGDPKSKKRCKGNKKNRRKNKKPTDSAVSTGIFKPEMTLNDVIHKLCIPLKSDFVMYHTKGNNFESVAFDRPDQKSIQDLRWKIRRGRLHGRTAKKMVLAVTDFRRDVTVADIVGAVHKDQIKRFLRMMNKRKRRCKKPCRRKLIGRLVKKVKSTKLDLSKSCEV